MNGIKENILNSVKILIDESVKTLKFDKTFKTTIWGKNDDGTYKISYKNQLYDAPNALGTELKLGQSVWAKIPNGIFRDMHIYGSGISVNNNDDISNLSNDVVMPLTFLEEDNSLKYYATLHILSHEIGTTSITVCNNDTTMFSTSFDIYKGNNTVDIHLNFTLAEGINNLRFVTSLGYILAVETERREKLPYLTSNTTILEDGTYVVSGSSLYTTDYDYYKPFMENNNRGIYDAWHPAYRYPQWLMLELPTNRIVSSFRMYNRTNYIESPGLVRFEGSIDGENWDVIKTFRFSQNTVANVVCEVLIPETNKAYNKYRWYLESVIGNYGVISKIELFFSDNKTYKSFV